jgi:hypothetical protein
MQGHVIATLMARESTRRALTEPPRDRRPRRRVRPAAARMLQSVAHRLDPAVASPVSIR